MVYSLPLELRNAVYDYALQDDHDFFADGVPALFKVCPEITREIYSYRKIITTTIINAHTPGPLETKDQNWDKITKFKQKKNTKGLVVKFRYLELCEQRVLSSGLPDFIASIRSIMKNGCMVIKLQLYAMLLISALDVEAEVIDEKGGQLG